MRIAVAMRLEHLNGQFKYFCNETYIKKILQFHHLPIPICDITHIHEIVELCDALIIPGGYDILPFYFDQPTQEKCTFYDANQDAFDFAIIRAFVHAKKPILGICRGMQLLAVYFNSSLRQHIDTTRHMNTNSHQHSIMCTPDSFLSLAYPPIFEVNSYHHQVVDCIGKDLMVSAYAMDGTIEAIQHIKLPIYGVQWHPEIIVGDHVFEYFFHITLKHSLSSFDASLSTNESTTKP